ncbi:hypothetical protein ROZALSC1DRAFT_28268 [Rozella allomycis CSF55]|uniref:Uncharacterized protein n=1 Tax=Rozella allomycis (strain CSF55) TaxID=988480 RepID=A0A4P9YNK2_ROZAC|nr:hypothetical protein ROZALSC1DRAFT_28268 [Rozella allomycis CSF55]
MSEEIKLIELKYPKDYYHQIRDVIVCVNKKFGELPCPVFYKENEMSSRFIDAPLNIMPSNVYQHLYAKCIPLQDNLIAILGKCPMEIKRTIVEIQKYAKEKETIEPCFGRLLFFRILAKQISDQSLFDLYDIFQDYGSNINNIAVFNSLTWIFLQVIQENLQISINIWNDFYYSFIMGADVSSAKSTFDEFSVEICAILISKIVNLKSIESNVEQSIVKLHENLILSSCTDKKLKNTTSVLSYWMLNSQFSQSLALVLFKRLLRIANHEDPKLKKQICFYLIECLDNHSLLFKELANIFTSGGTFTSQILSLLSEIQTKKCIFKKNPKPLLECLDAIISFCDKAKGSSEKDTENAQTETSISNIVQVRKVAHSIKRLPDDYICRLGRTKAAYIAKHKLSGLYQYLKETDQFSYVYQLFHGNSFAKDLSVKADILLEQFFKFQKLVFLNLGSHLNTIIKYYNQVYHENIVYSYVSPVLQFTTGRMNQMILALQPYWNQLLEIPAFEFIFNLINACIQRLGQLIYSLFNEAFSIQNYDYD